MIDRIKLKIPQIRRIRRVVSGTCPVTSRPRWPRYIKPDNNALSACAGALDQDALPFIPSGFLFLFLARDRADYVVRTSSHLVLQLMLVVRQTASRHVSGFAQNALPYYIEPEKEKR
jgi:hypothetical protein